MNIYQFRLFRNLFKQAASFVLLGAVLLNSFPSAAQTKKLANPTKKTAAPSAENSFAAPENSPLATV